MHRIHVIWLRIDSLWTTSAKHGSILANVGPGSACSARSRPKVARFGSPCPISTDPAHAACILGRPVRRNDHNFETLVDQRIVLADSFQLGAAHVPSSFRFRSRAACAPLELRSRAAHVPLMRSQVAHQSGALITFFRRGDASLSALRTDVVSCVGTPANMRPQQKFGS